MSLETLDRPSWYRALTLGERLEAPPPRAESPEPERLERADRLVRRWCEQTPFREEGLGRRLAADGLSEETFRAVLAEREDRLQRRLSATVPGWLAELRQAFADPRPIPPAFRDGWLRACETHPFLVAARPLVSRACERLEGSLHAAVSADGVERPYDPASFGGLLLFGALREALGRVLTRTFVLEMHVARLEDRLEGETAQRRFASFIERVARPGEALALFEEYPLLARRAVECVRDWERFARQVAEHLAADWHEMVRTFDSGGGVGPVEEVVGGLSDPHRGGRSVLRLRFSGGLELMYKPKSLAVEVGFQELVELLEGWGFRPAFRTLRILDRGDHGWVERVRPESCRDLEEVQRFYRRQGGYLALLHALEATDFHYENLIAVGEHPVLVDLETLFHPRMDGPVAGVGVPGEPYQRSILRIGMLPQRLWGEEGEEGMDTSGLGGAAGQLTPDPVLDILDRGTDRMRFTRHRVEVPVSQNRPTLRGEPVRAEEHADALASGFADMYRLIVRRRDELLAPDGPLAALAAAEVRVLVRPTRAYDVLQFESLHPQMLRDALSRDRLLDRLWSATTERRFLERLFPLERAQLERGDIPIFTTRPDSRHLWSGCGARLDELFERSGLEVVRDRIAGMDAAGLERELGVLQGALRSVELGNRPKRWPALERVVPAAAPAVPERLVAAARRLGDRLAELAYRDQGASYWLTLRPIGPGRAWSFDPVGVDLYSGQSGIALFLATLARATGAPRYHELAREATLPVGRRLEASPGALAGIGAFSGWGGVLYAHLHLARLHRSPEHAIAARRAAGEIARRIDEDESLDLIAGAAGAILSLARLHRGEPAKDLLAAAVRCGDHLLDRAVPAAGGLGWMTAGAGPVPLAGLSHGAGGMAWALAELAHLSGEDRFLEASRAALAYERSVFSEAEGNWPDLREDRVSGAEPGEGDGFMTAWCHGAPGIVLSRLGILAHEKDPAERRTLQEEIRTAAETTWRTGFGGNDSLCHGGLGNVDVLLTAGRALEAPRLCARAEALAARLLERIERGHPRCGVPCEVEVPGLMTGLAGIGYLLLRLADPEGVPSVLALAPPTAGAGTGKAPR